MSENVLKEIMIKNFPNVSKNKHLDKELSKPQTQRNLCQWTSVIFWNLLKTNDKKKNLESSQKKNGDLEFPLWLSSKEPD